MKTGLKGTFVISWSQSEIDGLSDAPMAALNVGAAWLWRGDAIRVDGPNDVVRLDRADGAEALRRRAARMVHRLVGAALEREVGQVKAAVEAGDAALMGNAFVVTDGAQRYTVTVIDIPDHARLLMFLDELPPRGCDLWIVHHTLDTTAADAGAVQGGVICFTPCTRIRTPQGPVAVEHLREGDLVQTKDSGAQEIRWIGSRRMTGARMFATPKLRPIRLRAQALGLGEPDGDLLVSPEHRVVVKSHAARDLFNTDEVLVMARDLVNGGSIDVDRTLREVTYVHLLLDAHQVVWANGVETESFHPASAALGTLSEADRARLLDLYPGLERDPHRFGGYARRSLTASEAAILGHAA